MLLHIKDMNYLNIDKMTLVDMGFCNLVTPVYKRYQALIPFVCHIHQSSVIEPLGMMHVLLVKTGDKKTIFLFCSIRS